MKKIKYFYNILLFFILSYLIGEFLKFNAFKNSGIVGMLLCGLYFICFHKKQAIRNFKKNIKNFKFLIFTTFALLFFVFLISLFSYSGDFSSIQNASRQYRRVIIFLFVTLFCYSPSKSSFSKGVYICIIITFISTIIQNLCSINFNSKRLIDRNFSFLVDLFLPFLITSIFVFKNKYLKFSSMLFIIISLCMMVLTGARGSYLSNFLMLSLLMAILFQTNRLYFRQFMKFFVVLSIIMIAPLSFYLWQNKNIIEKRFIQLSSSGRDQILLKRFHYFYKSDRFLYGIGYGGGEYNKFLLDKSNKSNLGPGIYKKGVAIKYHHDEPTFLAQFYHYGIFSIFYLILVFYLFGVGIKEFYKNKNYLTLSLSLSIFSCFIVRGLFEGIDIREIILYSSLMIIFKGRK